VTAYPDFVAERSTALLRTAYLLTGDRAQATDLLLTGLAAVRRHWTPATGADAATQLARRAMVASHTGWQRRIELGHLLADSPLLSGASALPGFSSSTADHGRRSGTSAALARLPARSRAALVLRYGEGLPEPAVAELLARPAEDVAAETERGLAALGELLSGETTPADVERRLRHDLGEQAAEVTATPDGVAGLAQERDRGDRRHLAGLLALVAFAVAVVLVVLFSLR